MQRNLCLIQPAISSSARQPAFPLRLRFPPQSGVTSGSEPVQGSPGRTRPPSRLCPPNQRFAFGFLQISSRPRHPGRSANSSPCRASRRLPPPSECALPGAPQKKGELSFAFEVLAEWTGLEPATPGVTGRYSNRLNYHSIELRLPINRLLNPWNLHPSTGC